MISQSQDRFMIPKPFARVRILFRDETAERRGCRRLSSQDETAGDRYEAAASVMKECSIHRLQQFLLFRMLFVLFEEFVQRIFQPGK